MDEFWEEFVECGGHVFEPEPVQDAEQEPEPQDVAQEVAGPAKKRSKQRA